MPTTTSRWFFTSVSGSPRRQASTKSPAQPTASTMRTRRSRPRTAVSEAAQKAKPCQTTLSRRLEAPTTSRTNEVRRAMRPTLLLPATSWAEPGRNSVITIRVTARRNRTLAARSGVRRTRSLACSVG